MRIHWYNLLNLFALLVVAHVGLALLRATPLHSFILLAFLSAAFQLLVGPLTESEDDEDYL